MGVCGMGYGFPQGMGYGSRALSLLHDYYSGKITSLNEEVEPMAEALPTTHTDEVYIFSELNSAVLVIACFPLTGSGAVEGDHCPSLQPPSPPESSCRQTPGVTRLCGCGLWTHITALSVGANVISHRVICFVLSGSGTELATFQSTSGRPQ